MRALAPHQRPFAGINVPGQRPHRSGVRCSCHAGQKADSAAVFDAVYSTGLKRRHLFAALPAAAAGWTLTGAAPAHATNVVAEFLKSRQRQDGGIKMLAPLRVAQARLHEALDLLTPSGGAVPVGGAAGDDALLPTVSEDVLKSALRAVRASSLNCYVFDPLADDTLDTRASLFTQQFVQSADPCTFRIILKNVTNLSSEDVRAAGTAKMDSLVLDYQKLDSYLEMAWMGNADALPKAREQLKVTLAAAADIEAFVAEVLGV